MPAVRLERMAHRDKDIGNVHPERNCARLPAVLRRNRGGPGELLVRAIVDLRNAKAERGALGERPLVAEVPHLGVGIVSYSYATALELLGPSVRRADLAWPERNGQTDGPLLRLHIAGSELVGVVLVCRPDVHHAEVVAAAHGEARVGLSNTAPVLVLHGGTEDTRPAAQASPRQRGRP